MGGVATRMTSAPDVGFSSAHVWIDQDLCTGDGLCTDTCPAIFQLGSDGIAYVKEPWWRTIHGADSTSLDEAWFQGPAGLVEVPDELGGAVLAAAEVCPGECIFVEFA